MSNSSERRHPCAACGYLVHDEPAGSYAICPVCDWEDDASQLAHPRTVGANALTLVEKQREALPLARITGRVRDAAWRPLVPADLDVRGELARPGPGPYWLR